eukprot:TRINITY_DN15246_c0_g1_i3.p1 TRINITY_DN15246_c0_g1~~TRINITY_DN15246_c0_g1_i3.p1  ORF type:complete len:104 (+),score=17.75 TRINITY_DN15246_c0_g1_i3:76-387(+)
MLLFRDMSVPDPEELKKEFEKLFQKKINRMKKRCLYGAGYPSTEKRKEDLLFFVFICSPPPSPKKKLLLPFCKKKKRRRGQEKGGRKKRHNNLEGVVAILQKV